MGYYGDHPSDAGDDPDLAALDRPLLLIGPPGAGVGSVAAALCSLTGWPLADLDRRVEHDAGRSLAALLRAEGGRMARAREAAALARALQERPPAVIAAGPFAFEHLDSRRQAAAGAQVVCLLRPLEALRAGLAAERSRSPGALPGVEPADIPTVSDALLAQLFDGALRVDVGASPPWAAARAVLAALGR
jgi:shikimate kinase